MRKGFLFLGNFCLALGLLTIFILVNVSAGSQAGKDKDSLNFYDQFWKDESGKWLCGFQLQNDQLVIYNNSKYHLLFEVMRDCPACNCSCLVARNFLEPNSNISYPTGIISSCYYSFTVWGKSVASHQISGEDALRLVFDKQ